jgi:monoamine oxidase
MIIDGPVIHCDLFILETSTLSFQALLTMRQHVNVLIVGGGISGLAAGKVLSKDDINFLIVEAQDYLGGRVNTVSVDTGKSWHHNIAPVRLRF